MWDKDTPLLLLNTMPKLLEDEHLNKLQLLLEADRYKNQIISGVDLCGIYAPFCYGCNKDSKYSCAVAYVNYLKEQGTDIQIAADASEENASDENKENVTEGDVAPAPVIDNAEQSLTIDNVESAPVIDDAEPAPVVEESEEPIEEVESEEEPNATDEGTDTSEEEPNKTKIRIAIARKKTLL